MAPGGGTEGRRRKVPPGPEEVARDQLPLRPDGAKEEWSQQTQEGQGGKVLLPEFG